jgi:hypothetical protein
MLAIMELQLVCQRESIEDRHQQDHNPLRTLSTSMTVRPVIAIQDDTRQQTAYEDWSRIGAAAQTLFAPKLAIQYWGEFAPNAFR